MENREQQVICDTLEGSQQISLQATLRISVGAQLFIAVICVFYFQFLPSTFAFAFDFKYWRWYLGVIMLLWYLDCLGVEKEGIKGI